MTVNLTVTDITPQNKREKMMKAVRSLSQRLGVPVSVEGRKKQHGGGGCCAGEPFMYRSHEELIYRWYNRFSAALNQTYNFVVSYFGLPEVRVIAKADVLKYKGKIIYSPETGEPIKQYDWDNFVKLLEKFLNQRLKDSDKKIILDSKALGRILSRMLKYNRLDDVKALGLDDIKYRGKSFDWISDSVKNMRTAMGEELSRSEMARIQVLQMSAAQKITGISDRMKGEIKQILIDGVIARKSKGQISQELFDKMTGRNRDFQMIADTEIQNALNNATLLDEVNSAEPGEKVYFQRVEVIDQNTCKFCKKMHGKVVLWSDHPLTSDKIDDPIAEYVIWDGKNWDGKKEMVANGAFHPYCFSSDTEVMTHRGWKLFKDLLDDDRIMSINPENQEIDFVPFVKRIEYQYDGKMIHFLGWNYDLMVTPNHNMLYVTQRGDYRSAEAKELINRRIYLPRAVGKWRNGGVGTDIVSYADRKISHVQYFRLWAWYLAEGNGYTKGANGHVCFLTQKDPDKILDDLYEIRDIFSVYEKPGPYKIHSLSFTGKYAEPFKEMFRVKAINKYIPQFIKDGNTEEIRAFLDAYSLADGSKNVMCKSKGYGGFNNTTVVRTSSKKMADDLCELIVKAGWMPSIGIKKEKGNKKNIVGREVQANSDLITINICKSKYRHFNMPTQEGHNPNWKPYETSYSGMVYDVELERWHFLLVRRNGKCAWSGNCRGNWVRYSGANVNALVAEIQGKAKDFNEALEAAKKEWKEEKGIENPNDQTPGFTERVSENYHFGPQPDKVSRKKFGIAFNQAKKEFEDKGIGLPTGKTPGFHDRIKDIYQELIGKSFNPNQARDAQGRWSPDTGGLGGSGSREPWNSSTDKARELKAEDWGTPEEIAEMAEPIRVANNRREAIDALESIISEGGANKRSSIPLKSKHGLTAYIRRSSIGKLVSSGQAKTMPPEAVFLAAANIDKLFPNAIEPWEFALNPIKENSELKERHYLYSPMKYNNRIIPVKITVKEYKDTGIDKKIYAIEAIDVEIQGMKKGNTGTLSLNGYNPPVTPSSYSLKKGAVGMLIAQETILPYPSKLSLNTNIAHLFDSVNGYLRNNTVSKRVSKALYGEDMRQKSLAHGKDRPEYSISDSTKKSCKDRVQEALCAGKTNLGGRS